MLIDSKQIESDRNDLESTLVFMCPLRGVFAC